MPKLKIRLKDGLLPAACLLYALFAVAQVSALSPAERILFTATNQARADQGLPPLKWDGTLAQAAQAHAVLMVQNSELSHHYSGEPDLAQRAAQAGAHFQTIAENIAMGPSPEVIQKEWMKSPQHRANILDPTLNAVGIAVIKYGSYWYAVADFEHNVDSLAFDQVESAIEKLLLSQGVRPTPSLRQDARQTCEMSHGIAGGSKPGFVMRWQSSDLSGLPNPLMERLRSGEYHTAAIGACDSANAEQGFTTYRLAVLLY
jgi:hypothetical protein